MFAVDTAQLGRDKMSQKKQRIELTKQWQKICDGEYHAKIGPVDLFCQKNCTEFFGERKWCGYLECKDMPIRYGQESGYFTTLEKTMRETERLARNFLADLEEAISRLGDKLSKMECQ